MFSLIRSEEKSIAAALRLCVVCVPRSEIELNDIHCLLLDNSETKTDISAVQEFPPSVQDENSLKIWPVLAAFLLLRSHPDGQAVDSPVTHSYSPSRMCSGEEAGGQETSPGGSRRSLGSVEARR